jgi:hypothetical protein
MDEEGEITVKAVEHPCEESGSQFAQSSGQLRQLTI